MTAKIVPYLLEVDRVCQASGSTLKGCVTPRHQPLESYGRQHFRGRLDPIILEEFISDFISNVFGCHEIGMSFQLEFQRMTLPCHFSGIHFISFHFCQMK